jgi:hypothetical protein
MAKVIHKRRWGLLTRALELIQSSIACSEVAAFDVLKALIVDDRAHARGLWPSAESGQWHRKLPPTLLSAKDFASAVRIPPVGVHLVSLDITLPWVEIDMKELRIAIERSEHVLPYVADASMMLSGEASAHTNRAETELDVEQATPTPYTPNCSGS